MSGENDNQDKNFDPTPSRIDRARREGDVAQSKELTAAATYAGLYLAIIGASASAMTALAISLALLLNDPEAFSATSGITILAPVTGSALVNAAPFFVFPAIAAAASLAGQRAVTFSLKKIQPKWSRLSPVENAKQKFGVDGLSEFLKSTLKLILVLGAFGAVVAAQYRQWPAFSELSSKALASELQSAAVILVGVIVLFSTAVALVDLVWVRARHLKRLMMSFEELKQESRESEGDPHLRAARRERAKAMATNRMLLDVPKASVVIVNPEHYAVALRWDGPKGGAPTLVAKGVDAMAAKIRELAAAAGVPIRRDAPTARAIYAAIEVGEEVKREHYAAVAAAIHFAEAVRKRTAQG
jgi:flagellar biosynthetic protein FlhB